METSTLRREILLCIPGKNNNNNNTENNNGSSYPIPGSILSTLYSQKNSVQYLKAPFYSPKPIRPVIYVCRTQILVDGLHNLSFNHIPVLPLAMKGSVDP